MRRTYLQPTIIINNISLPPLLTASLTEGSLNNISIASEEYDGETVLSRDGSDLWDDDDDNNY